MKKTFLIFGFIPSIISIGGKLVVYYSNNEFNNQIILFTGVLSIVALFTCIFFSIKHVRKNVFNDSLTLKQAMQAGIGVSIISALIIGIFTFLFLKYIDVEFIAYHLEQNRKGMEAEKMPIEKINENIKTLSEEVLTPFRLALKTIGSTAIVGMVMSFISSTFLIKNPTENNVD